MKGRKPRWLSGLLTGWWLLAAGFGQKAWAQEGDKCATEVEGEQVSVGYAAHDFELPDLEGKSVKLSDILKDEKVKAVALEFMSYTCSVCEKQIPLIQNALKSRQKDGKNKDGIVFLAISVDDVDAKVLKNYAERSKLNFRILQDRDRKVTKKYGVKVTPTVFVLDKQQKVAGVYPGLISDENDYVDFISRVLTAVARGTKPPSLPATSRRAVG